MKRALPWMVVAVQLIALGMMSRTQPDTGFTTLPIFTPLSPELEQAMRKERGQPTPISPREALKRAEAEIRNPTSQMTTADLRTLADTMKALRTERDSRHHLNVEMMNTAVSVAEQLEPQQWAWIHMHRDARDGSNEANVFKRLNKQLSQTSD